MFTVSNLLQKTSLDIQAHTLCNSSLNIWNLDVTYKVSSFQSHFCIAKPIFSYTNADDLMETF